MQVRYRAALRPELCDILKYQRGKHLYKKNLLIFIAPCDPPASSGMRYRAALRPETFLNLSGYNGAAKLRLFSLFR
jgi:hypothetical protein